MRLHLPLEFSVGILAALTLLFTLPPLNSFAIFGIFIFWGAAFLLGSPNLEGVKKLVPPTILGTLFGIGTYYLFLKASPAIGVGGNVYLSTLVNGVILFVVVTVLVYFARIPIFSTIAAAFCAFATFVATVYGGFGIGTAPYTPFNAWLAATLMCCLGPFFAWASVALTRPATAPAVEKKIEEEGVSHS